ncbi:cobalt ABC transporter, inner membrane subunit CbiQ [Dehalogenimonas lykanthroporepellens BL-DC-9]|nr:cobalt ABC transporter, inner membrane subunit CbiQ [Dehalogenimonas lykanthroporepellens BL-DC-9]
MKLDTVIDEYSHLDSPFHRWELRTKLIGFLALIFVFSFVDEPVMLAVIAGLSLMVYALSGLPLSFLRRRLRYPSFFLLVLLIIIPFTSGQTVMVALGPLELKEEGLASAVVIGVRFLSILVMGIVLFGTAPFMDTIKAMRRLGLPAIMVDMILLTFRYLHQIGSDLERMQLSAGLRGFRLRPFAVGEWRVPAWLSGSLIVRSYERSEAVYRAMRLRGYGYDTRGRQDGPAVQARDIMLLVLAFSLAAALTAANITLGHDSAGLLQ